MALFKNAATEWEKTMTENDLDQMEAQGLDVSKYREKLAARRAKEAEEAKRDRELYKNPTQLDKMKPYMQTPRSLAKEEDCWSTVKLSGEIVEGADVEVRKLVLYYKELPQGYLPSDGIVPHFYWEGTIRVIPAELYV